MSTQSGSPLNVVHEAIDERQHVRTKLRSMVRLTLNGKSVACELNDISLGGMSISTSEALEVGQVVPVVIEFDFENFDINLDASAKVVSFKNGAYGMSFVDIEKKKSDTLRYIISSYLSGDVVNVDGVLNVVQRENLIKQRKVKADSKRSLGDRLKAIVGTALYFSAGLAIFSLLAFKLYLYFFRVDALDATVTADTYLVQMPENGYVSYLLPGGTHKVEKGQAIASVSTQLHTNFNTADDLRALSEISETDLQTLMGKAFVETTITSPCDCVVQYVDKPLSRYAYKDQPLMHLFGESESPYVKATFPFTKIDKLNTLRSVSVQVLGQPKAIPGEVVRSEVDRDTHMLIVYIKPETPIAMSDFGKPAAVYIDTGFSWMRSTLVSEAMALVPAR